MSNRKSSHQNRVRLWLAALKLRKDLLHLKLKANFNPNQARVPAGNPDGGRWTDDGRRTANSTGETGVTQRAVRDRSGDKPWRAYVEQRRVDGSLISTTVYNRDGSVIVSERPNAATERNTVTLRDGARFIFENSGDAQRIYDAAGNLISSAVWTPDGPLAQPIVQQALFDSRKPKGPSPLRRRWPSTPRSSSTIGGKAHKSPTKKLSSHLEPTSLYRFQENHHFGRQN